MTSSAHVQGMEWATSIFGSVERSRNVITLSGVLDIEDLEIGRVWPSPGSYLATADKGRSEDLLDLV
jgi:hypothetical protein